MNIILVEYWRRTLDGYEYSSNRLFEKKNKAYMTLIMSGYKPIDKEELTFKKGDMKANITEREVE